MIIDGNSLVDGTQISCDVVIVGGGMAGLCIANFLSKYDIDVCILESGGEVVNHFSTSLSEADGLLSAGDGVQICMNDYMRESRQRSLGGTGNLWGGKCGVFESKDLEERSWISGSVWPIKYADLKKYYDLACYELNLPSLLGESLQILLKDRCPMALNNLYDFGTSYRLFSSMMGTDPNSAFNEYKYRIAKNKNIRVVLNATVTEIEYSNDGKSVTGLSVFCENRSRHLVAARHYVLAAGGLENPRLLMNSTNNVSQNNEFIGRFLSGHTVFKNIASDESAIYMRFNEGISNMDLYTCKDPAKIQGIFTLTQKAQWRERMANFSVTLEEPIKENGKYTCPIFFMVEQIPNPESRIVLSEKKDFYGMKKINMDWRFHPDDLKNVNKGVKLFSKFIHKSGVGSLSSDLLCEGFLEKAELSRHHIGTTRMSRDANSGVVDQNCKVHNIDNLYIAGSSVFPTNALANPTLTILALAIRLSEQLRIAA